MRGERTAIEREMFTAVVLETVFGIGNSPLLSRVRFFIFPSSDQLIHINGTSILVDGGV